MKKRKGEKTRVQDFKKFSLFFAAIFSLFSVGCLQQDVQVNGHQKEAELVSSEVFQSSFTTYSKHRYDNSVSLKLFSGKILQVKHSLDYDCCADIKVHANYSMEELAGGERVFAINLTEKDVSDRETVQGKTCNMPCGYNVTAFLQPLAEKKYLLRVLGVEKNGSRAKIISEKIFEVKDAKIKIESDIGVSPQENSCDQDSDCSRASCCHSFSCINKDFKPDCEGIYCTQECRTGTFDCNKGYCTCDRGTCSPVFVQ